MVSSSSSSILSRLHHGEIESGREPRIYEWPFLVVDLEPRLRTYIL